MMLFQTQEKILLQTNLSNVFRFMSQICSNENMVIYAVVTNLRECIWYMKADFTVLCLKRLEKTVLFQQEYNHVNMSWIESFTDFLIHAVERGIDKYKKSRTGKMIEMILLPVTLYDDVSEGKIEDPSMIDSGRSFPGRCLCIFMAYHPLYIQLGHHMAAIMLLATK